MSKHIFLVHGFLLCGTGSNVYCFNLALQWKKQGHAVTIFCQDPDAASYSWVDAFYGPTAKLPAEAPKPGTVRVLTPDIAGLLPVYQYDDYKGYTVKTIPNCTQEEIDRSVNHNYTNIVQLHRFKFQKEHLKEGGIMISEDFSEKYSLKQQNEIMSAHWSQEQLSLFCATVHFLKNSEKTFQHYVLCSDDLGHDKDSIYYYNSYVINDMRSKGVTVHEVDCWSDGPSSQFKNQFAFTNLLFHEKYHNASADWNFFATSHGKGENDGVGGDVKNAVCCKTLQMKVVVTNLDEFVTVAQNKYPSFIIIACPSVEIRSNTDFLKDRYLNHSKPLKGTKTFHYVEIVNNTIHGCLLSPCCPCHLPAICEVTVPNIFVKPECGEFYKVIYVFQCEKGGMTTKILPAMCERNDLEEHLFTFSKRVANSEYTYKPDNEDKAWIHEDDVTEELPFPDMTRRGNPYKFDREL